MKIFHQEFYRKILRKFPLNPNLNVKDDKDLAIEQTGILIDGVEIRSQIPDDNVFFGPLSSIDMFLMFTLYREDVFPMGDLGIKKAIKKLYKMEDIPNKNEMQKISNKWKPYRTLACWYLWRYIDDEIFW